MWLFLETCFSKRLKMEYYIRVHKFCWSDVSEKWCSSILFLKMSKMVAMLSSKKMSDVWRVSRWFSMKYELQFCVSVCLRKYVPLLLFLLLPRTFCIYECR